jgi:hypothetical protein
MFISAISRLLADFSPMYLRRPVVPVCPTNQIRPDSFRPNRIKNWLSSICSNWGRIGINVYFQKAACCSKETLFPPVFAGNRLVVDIRHPWRYAVRCKNGIKVAPFQFKQFYHFGIKLNGSKPAPLPRTAILRPARTAPYLLSQRFSNESAGGCI